MCVCVKRISVKPKSALHNWDALQNQPALATPSMGDQ